MQITDYKIYTSAAHSAAKPADPRLARAAHEFEASLMGELLKSFQHGNGLNGDDEEEGSGNALAGFATESLARVISERGGFGIADRVLHELQRGGGKAVANSPAPGPLRQA